VSRFRSVGAAAGAKVEDAVVNRVRVELRRIIFSACANEGWWWWPECLADIGFGELFTSECRDEEEDAFELGVPFGELLL